MADSLSFKLNAVKAGDKMIVATAGRAGSSKRGLCERILSLGAVFPDYELSDHTGVHRKLSDLQGPDPLILVLTRGGFCPKDHRQAEGLVELHRELEVGYCRLVTISTDNLVYD